jgi:hypothetical protein
VRRGAGSSWIEKAALNFKCSKLSGTLKSTKSSAAFYVHREAGSMALGKPRGLPVAGALISRINH